MKALCTVAALACVASGWHAFAAPATGAQASPDPAAAHDPAPAEQWPLIAQKATRVLRIYDGPDGTPRAEEIVLPVWSKMPAEHVQLAVLPPNSALGRHRPARRHLIIPVRGATTMILSDALRVESHPGIILLVEDTRGRGHAGLVGADGYLGIDVTLADEASPAPAPAPVSVPAPASPAAAPVSVPAPAAVAVPRDFVVTAADGVTLAASVSGATTGTPILFVHGFGQSRWVYRTLLASALCSAHPCISFDLRGHGDSGKPDAAASYATAQRWAGDIDAVLRGATSGHSLPPPLIVAWSFGTAVAIDYLRVAGRDAVSGLVLIGGAGGLVPQVPRTDPAVAALRAKMIEDGRSTDPALRLSAYERSAHMLVATAQPADWYRTAAAVSMQVPLATREAILARHIDNADLVNAMPALFVAMAGENDASMTPATLEHLASAVPGARTLVYPAAGHTPFVEFPQRFERDLSAIVESIGTQPRSRP